MTHDNSVKAAITDLEQAKNARQNFEWLWQEIATLVLPRRDFTVRMNRGAQRRNQIFDGVGVWANEQLSSALHSFLTNPTLKWIAFKMNDPVLNARHDVQVWLHEARDAVLDVFSGADSNFHPQAHELYMDLCAFGTGCMFIHNGEDITFQTRPLGEIYVKENARGFVDTVMREYPMTARQAVQEYKRENVPASITAAMEHEPEKEFMFLHTVRPREDRNQFSQRSDNLPWASQHIILDDSGTLVRDSGFREFPYVVPRWSKVAGERYGRGPGMTALPELKMLQAMSVTVIKAAQKVVDPPLMAPDDGFLSPPVTKPGSINYFRASSKNRIEPLVTKGRIDIGLDLMDARREAVLRAFFLDIMSLREGPQMTATEVLDRRDTRLRQMSPMVSRLQVEFLSPLVKRVFALMVRRGEIPPPPEDILGKPWKIDFVSPAALAQRASELDNINRWLGLALPIIELDPPAKMNIDLNEIIRTAGSILNVPPALIIEKDIVDARQAEQAEQAQQQAQMAQLQQAGEAGAAIKEAVSEPT